MTKYLPLTGEDSHQRHLACVFMLCRPGGRKMEILVGRGSAIADSRDRFTFPFPLSRWPFVLIQESHRQFPCDQLFIRRLGNFGTKYGRVLDSSEIHTTRTHVRHRPCLVTT
ncbi:hypothetical protein PAXRUDRAFT_395385 [Paxillus rubicundulus Ve08.2h10]|uniref:Unplaced genomic scaffold scaffold_23, whole genome shotgun sequence n=1 Tax=Paxillus rubicundulus Ve08.2h10 TaxID=930991 RepID=A0A0D0E5L7_9AGAM|nr:hypothetical protein PAXRUDRAFT_395385 [Paxillus rubicundulus Ve08.2h10]